MTGPRGAPIQNAIFFLALIALIALAISSALFLRPKTNEEKAETPVPPTVIVVVVNSDGTVRATPSAIPADPSSVTPPPEAPLR